MAERQTDRYKPLLCAVVEVALEPAPLGVARGDDPGTRGLHLLELAAQLDSQPHDLDRQPGRLHRLHQQPWLLVVHRLVKHQTQWSAGAGHRRVQLPVTRAVARRAPVCVDVDLALRQPEAQLQAGISRGPR